jgi:hypothetical protein
MSKIILSWWFESLHMEFADTKWRAMGFFCMSLLSFHHMLSGQFLDIQQEHFEDALMQN